MITIKNDRTAYIPERDRNIGFENDHLVESRVFEICDTAVHGFSFKLDVAETMDIIDLEKQFTENGRCRLVWNITADAIGKGGIIKVQIRAFDSEGERVWHSEIMEFTGKSSVNAEKEADDEKTLSEFEQLETRVTAAVEQAEEASEIAETAATVVADSVKSFEQAYGTASDNVTKAENHYSDQNNPHGVTPLQIGASEAGHSHENADAHIGSTDNPHSVTASQVGAYTKDEVVEIVESSKPDLTGYVKNTDYASADVGGVVKVRNETYGLQVNANSGVIFIKKATNADIDSKAHGYKPIVPSNLEYAVKSVGDGYYAKESDVFETGSFGWTGFAYTLPTNEEGSYVSDSVVNVGGTDQSVVVHCAGKTLGFTFSILGYSDAYLKINGITTTYTNSAYDGSEFATNIVIPPTYMESDIEFSGGMNTWKFTDMTIQSIKGMGDIDEALDGILAIQNELIGGDA